MNITYTVAQIIDAGLSKIGVKYAETEIANIELAHRNLNLILAGWASDPDMAVNRIVPTTGYTALDDIVDLPPEYCHALVLTLALEMAADFDQNPSRLLVDMAAGAISNIKIFNIRRQKGNIPANGALE